MNKQQAAAVVQHLQEFAASGLDVETYMNRHVRIVPWVPEKRTEYLTKDKKGRVVKYGYKELDGRSGYYVECDSNGLNLGKNIPIMGKTLIKHLPFWGIEIPDKHLELIKQNLPI